MPQMTTTMANQGTPCAPPCATFPFNGSEFDLAQDTNWYSNSRATNHITADPNNLLARTKFFDSEQVLVGDGKGFY